MSNALECVFIARTEDELLPLSGFTAADGVDHRGILRALRTIGLTPGEIREARADVAIIKVVESLRNGRPVILCVDGWDHWVVAFGRIGSTVLVCDSADNRMVIPYTPGDLLDRWRIDKKGRNFYGIIV